MITTHPSAAAGTSQCDIILAELQAHPGEWVPMPRLVRLSGSYVVHSRIADLRKRGHAILHENRRTQGSRIVRSFYQIPA